ncbi:MAG: helix-turn-helix domain-containing protein [Parcubacteria group bacterium]
MKNLFVLSENEKKILASLYRLEDYSVGKIAKDTFINRTTLYPILDNLVEKGLVSKVKIEGKTIFQPISTRDFNSWAKRKETEFQESNENLENWIAEQNKSKKVSLVSEIKYFEGFDGVKNLYADTWRENDEKTIRAITDYKNAKDFMKKYFSEEYFPQRIRHGVKVKNIIPESKIGREYLKSAKEFLREMKFVNILNDLNIEINIYDSKVSIVAFDPKNPSGVLIKNQKIAEAMKNIFEYLWKTAR